MSIIRELARLGNKIDSASTGEFLSKGTSTGSFDAISYSSITGKPTVLDSALSSQLIDSSYVQLRQTVSGGGLDSALTTQLIDSSYVSARAGAASSGYQVYEYTATQGQTTFQDSDLSGNLLSYTSGGALVFYNGVLMGPDDITATSGSSVVLASGADSGSHVSIAKWSVAGGGGSSFSWGGTRAVMMGGYSSGVSRETKIQYWDISTSGNASDFGDLTSGRYQCTGLSNATRGLCARGVNASDAGLNNIDYVTIATTGNSTDFGDCLGASKQNARNGCCDGTTGLWAGQDIDGSGYQNVIERITVATTGNASDHGDMTGSRIYVPMANDASRYVTMGGYAAGGANQINNIDYGTFVAGNSTDFGDLIQLGHNAGALSDTTRAVKAGGYYSSNQNVIEYVTIQTPGNATDFGDLLSAQNGIGGMSDGTNGQFAGGWTYATPINTVVIQTTGNATDHGDLDTGLASAACCSGNAS